MGKRGRPRNRNRKPHFTDNSKKTENNENKDERKPYQDIIRENEAFVSYYMKQEICKDDWDEFLAKIKSDLPSSFRITASKSEANALLGIVENHYINECTKQAPDDKKEAFFPLPWYPNRMAWQLGLTRKDIRRNEAYYRFHNFLISETQNGTVSRQETVSMIPPLVLDVQSHHKVLDMCAAPGSKTAQLIEMLHADEKTIPTGYVIANDIDNNRCYMLVHQAKRLNSPCIAITNHNSQFMPNMFAHTSDGGTEKVEFDRILCDVPCSGDGTLRKNPDIWMKWTPANGLNQHGVQFRIARRGAELLTVGGRMVYSTCSLNPVENEAVIHRLLDHCNGGLQLVDVGDMLKGLKHAPGMEDWLVASRQLEYYKSFDEVDEKWLTTIRPQMFPPKPEDRSKYNLHKCVRIFPHYQDTGAFFVAVLEKIKPIVNKTENQEQQPKNNEDTMVTNNDADSDQSNDGAESKPKKMKMSIRQKKKLSGYKEDPFVFFKDDEDVWSSIKEYYEILDEFDPKCLLTRCHVGKKKNIYFCSPAVRDIVMLNQGSIKFINTGLKTFVRSDNRHMTCAFRLAHEGLDSMIPYLQGRKVNIPKEDLLKLLANTDPQKSPEIVTMTQEVQDQVKELTPGSCILCYEGTESSGKEELILKISGWRGTSSLRCYVTDFNAAHYLRLLGGDFSKYDVNKFQKTIDVTDEVQEKLTMDAENR
ncbi:NOP2-Sun domain family member 2 [Carabus blaptoides fortunei]